jgi:hypothetical protein
MAHRYFAISTMTTPLRAVTRLLGPEGAIRSSAQPDIRASASLSKQPFGCTRARYTRFKLSS